METILVVGASGNIGVSTIIGALRSQLRVLAIVRNKAAGDRIFQHVGTTTNITLVEADVTSEDGVEKVVQQVRDGKLPAFQHVYAAVGMLHYPGALHQVELSEFHRIFTVSFMANYYAYRATAPYLLEQGNPNSTWTLCTGGGGDSGSYGVTSICQGALFSMAAVICQEKLPIRFNEIYLFYRVDYDSVCEEKGTADRMKASEFGRVFEAIIADTTIRDSRISVRGPDDVKNLKIQKKLDP